MPNPFLPLQSALRTLVDNAEVLPATGQAAVDLVTPDLEEITDRRTSGEAIIETVWETEIKSLYHTIRSNNKRLQPIALSRRKSAALRAFRLTLRRWLFPAPARRLHSEPVGGIR